jgi:hypothetical protein
LNKIKLHLDWCSYKAAKYAVEHWHYSKSLAVGKMVKKYCPGLKLIISFADERQGHHGIIYQAGNWIYTGKLKSTPMYYDKGKWCHQRQINSLYGTITNHKIRKDGGYRYRYLMPLTSEIKKQIEVLKKPYPKILCGNVVKEHISLSSEKVAV